MTCVSEVSVISRTHPLIFIVYKRIKQKNVLGIFIVSFKVVRLKVRGKGSTKSVDLQCV